MRYAVIGISVAMLAALGVSDALRSERLHAAAGEEQLRLDAIPLKFGDWTGEHRPMADKVVRNAGAVAYANRVYTRGGPRPGAVSVLILAGSPGDLAAHDPERCYGATGHRSIGGKSREQIDAAGAAHALWRQPFERETLPAGRIEVYWGWTTDGHWLAPEEARLEFSGASILYKIYVSRTLPPSADDAEPYNPAAELVAELIPYFQKALPTH